MDFPLETEVIQERKLTLSKESEAQEEKNNRYTAAIPP